MVEQLARKYALQNAILHDGKAEKGSVIGKVIAAKPELKSEIKEVIRVVASVVAKVNTLTLEQQRRALEAEAPELLEKKHERIIELPDLPDVENEVVMRFAPGPSGPLHIGHSRAAVLNDEFVKRYGGVLSIRLEDTNPVNIAPEAYDSILEDLDWLGVKYHDVVIQSNRFEIYYEHAKRLLERGLAYLCKCDVEDWRRAKSEKKPCPHRDAETENQLEIWDKMFSGAFDEHEVSYVIKTDLEHPNPAVRDFIGLRIVKTPHPRTGDKYLVYPLYNFSVAIDDHLMGMTHVLRGKDHLNNTYRQEYIFDHFDWKKPTYVHHGLVQIVDTILKTTLIKEGIKNGEFTGWDDIRLATLKALAKRGIEAKAIRDYWMAAGIKEVDIKFSWDNLNAFNKDIVDAEANRYFFVWSPKRLLIKGTYRLEGHAPLHPDHPERGIRGVVLEGKEGLTVFVTEDDIAMVAPGGKIRLKDLCNVKLISKDIVEYIGDDLSILKEGAKIIHWVGDDAVPTTLYMPDGSIKEGLSERILENDLGKVVQFERLGFVRVEKKEGGYVAYFAHK